MRALGEGGMVAAVSMKGKGKLSERSSSLGYFEIAASSSSRSLGVEAGHQEEMTT